MSDNWEKNEENSDWKSFEGLFVNDDRMTEQSNGVCCGKRTGEMSL